MARRPLIAGNWKMNKTVAETRALLGARLGPTAAAAAAGGGGPPPGLREVQAASLVEQARAQAIKSRLSRLGKGRRGRAVLPADAGEQ